MKKKPLVYIASPYSKGDQILNIRSSIEIFETLLRHQIVTPIAPLLANQVHLVFPHEDDTWMNYDLHLLLHCDAVFACNAFVQFEHDGSPIYYNQSESTGRDKEIEFAKEHNIQVFWDIDDLYTYFVSGQGSR